MARAERRAMNHRKDKRVLIVGFEKKFDSLTEARTELAMIWPETDQYLDTPAGGVVLNYSLLEKTDDELAANMKLLNGSGRASVLDSKGQETLLAKAFGVKGSVCLIGWGGAGFGWERPKSGGYMAFIETWPGRVFKGEEKVAAKAKSMGWRPNLETTFTRGQRRMGNVDDLKEFLAKGATEVAATLEPSRIRAEAADGQVL